MASSLKTSVSKTRDVPGQTGTGHPVVPLSRDKKKFLSRCPFAPGQGQEQMSRDKITPKKPGKRRAKTEKGVLKQENDVLKQEKDVLKQERKF